MKKLRISKKLIGIIIAISFILIILIVSPIVNERIKMKKELEKIYNDIDNIISKKIEELPSDYSEYFDIKSLDYSINRVYYTNHNYYGIEIDFNVSSDYEFDYSWDTEFALALYDLRDLFENNYKEVYFMNNKYNLNVNGRDVYSELDGSAYEEYVKESYQKYKIELTLDRIIWEYSLEGIKLKSMTNYMWILLCLFLFVVGALLYGAIIKFVKKMYDKSSTGAKIGVDVVKTLIFYFVIYIVLGILSGGIGFIALPVLFILENRK